MLSSLQQQMTLIIITTLKRSLKTLWPFMDNHHVLPVFYFAGDVVKYLLPKIWIGPCSHTFHSDGNVMF